MWWLAILATAEPVPVADPNAAARYAAISAVLVALITGVLALINRPRQRPAGSPPDLSEALVIMTQDRNEWRDRAILLGWAEP